MNKLVMFFFVSLLAISGVAAQVPNITSFTPSSGIIGTPVVITGINFHTTLANNTVYFGATKATVTAATATQLTVTVPAGATYQPISVTLNGLTAYSSKPFIVTFPGTGIIDANSFAAKVDYTTGTSPYIVALGDLDGDGKTDVAVPNYGDVTVSVLRNTSTVGTIAANSLAPKVDIAVSFNGSYDIAIADLDGDGKLDMAVVNAFVVGGATRVSVYKNTSSIGAITASSFAAKIDLTTDTSPREIAIGDLDGDGKPDIAVMDASGGAGANAVAVFKNTSTPGAISFAAKVEFITGALSGALALGDLDGDGKPDMAVANGGSNTVSVLRNTSSIGVINSSSFAAKVDFATGTGPTGVAISDLDGDGKPELTVTNSGSNTVSVFRNISSTGVITVSSFAAKIDFNTGSSPRGVTIGDLNGDAKLDIVVGTPINSTVSIFKNTSAPGSITVSSFDAKIDFTSGLTNEAAIGDIDGDGKPELVCASNANNTVSILRSTVISTPTISSFSPTNGLIGSTVTITGTNFSSTPTNNIVYFGATKATVTAATATQLTVTVQTGATYQPISVTVNGLTAYSSKPFIVTFPGTGLIDAN